MAQRRDSWLVSGVQAIMSVTGAGQVLWFVIGPTLPWAERKSVKTATLENDHNQKGHTECDHYQNGHTTLVKTATLFVQNGHIGWVEIWSNRSQYIWSQGTAWRKCAEVGTKTAALHWSKRPHSYLVKLLLEWAEVANKTATLHLVKTTKITHNYTVLN